MRNFTKPSVPIPKALSAVKRGLHSPKKEFFAEQENDLEALFREYDLLAEKDELHTLIESLQAGQTEAINALYVNDLILKLQHAEDIQNFLINAIENSTPEINQTVGAKRIAKAKALLEDYTQLERELKEKYTKNKLQHIKFINFLAGIGPNLTDINRTQILADNSLSQQDIKRLKDKVLGTNATYMIH